MSSEISAPVIVFTFDPPPASILRPHSPAPPALTWVERRAEVLFDLGVDAVIAYPTDRALLNLTADQFFRTFSSKPSARGRLLKGQTSCLAKIAAGTWKLCKASVPHTE